MWGVFFDSLLNSYVVFREIGGICGVAFLLIRARFQLNSYSCSGKDVHVILIIIVGISQLMGMTYENGRSDLRFDFNVRILFLS